MVILKIFPFMIFKFCLTKISQNLQHTNNVIKELFSTPHPSKLGDKKRYLYATLGYASNLV